MNEREKLELDVQDLGRVVAGIEAYALLTPKEFVDRLRLHPDDSFCEISDFHGTGQLQFTRDGLNAIFAIAERHISALPKSEDYSVDEIAGSIRKNLVRIIVEEKDYELVINRVLTTAEKEAQVHHIQRTYHFPCVLVRVQTPDRFSIGPVDFSNASTFPKLMEAEFNRWIASTDPGWPVTQLESFKNYIAELGWVATVVVPPCCKESSKARAQRSVLTAINLLRLLLGIPHAGDMRLAFTSPNRPVSLEFAYEENNKLHLMSSRNSQRGALVLEDWHQHMDRFQPFWQSCAHLLHAALAPVRSEIAERVIDALSWYGEAAAEPAPSTQIVKFVIALERITTVEKFSVHHFCSRVALLASETDAEFNATYWNARKIYALRSELMHGNRPKNAPEFLKGVRLAHDITRLTIFRALEIHCFLDDAGKLTGLKDLKGAFDRLQSKKADEIKSLRKELNKPEAFKATV